MIIVTTLPVDPFQILLKFEYYMVLLSLTALFLLWVKKKYPKGNLLFLIVLFFYRIPFLFIYHNYIPGDWIAYIEWAREWDLSGLPSKLGTDTIPYFLKYYVALDMNSIDMFAGFSFLGYIATVFVYLGIHYLTEYTDQVKFFGINIFPWILLYPSLHLFTQMVGKDPIVYLGISMFFYSLIGKKVNYFFLLLGFLSTLVVRPHIGVVLVASFGIAIMLSNYYKWQTKMVFIFAAILAGIRLMPIVISFFLLDTFSLVDIQSRIEKTSQHGDHASTYIDTSSYPIPLKMFTYLFRPMPHEFGTPFLLEYSFENLFFFIIFLQLFNWKFGGWLKKQSLALKFSFVFWLLGTLMLCNGLGVYGIFIRQKTMVFPLMLTFLFAFIYYKNTLKQKTL